MGIMQRKFQEFTACEAQDAGGKFLEQVGQIASPNYNVGSGEQQSITQTLAAGRTGSVFVSFGVLTGLSL